MQIRVSSPGHKLKDGDVDRIERDLEKIDRRLSGFNQVFAEVRISKTRGAAATFAAKLEVEYGRRHLLATGESEDIGQAVRAAREDILRQINDRGRGSHSQYAKGR
ncbi:MAG: HPF/RaiA family ribosome-associated protein [Actinomycetota bacterium]|nr:HPF/RaiA family ribosome-associated protein [Actinomycetota bacterium]